MPRYVQGDAFWEIEHEGTNLVITSGTVGTAGKEQVRRYKTAGHAEIQYDVMIREKVAAGFELSTASTAPVRDDDDPTRNAELEAAIAAEPYDTTAYAVYGDWLQARADPRGELISLQLAEDAKPGDAKLVAAIARKLEKQSAPLLGRLARHVHKLRDFSDAPFIWRFGFIHMVHLDRDEIDEPLADILAEVLEHPSGRFVAEVALRDDVQADVTAILRLLAHREPESLRAFELWTQATVRQLGAVLEAHPRLRRLAIRGRAGNADFSNWHDLLKTLATARLPELTHLELRLMNCDARFPQLRPILRRADLPALTHLQLRSADFPGEILAELIESPLAAQLVSLDLGNTEIGDRAGRTLLQHRERFDKLHELVVSHGELSATTVAELKASGLQLAFVDQDPDDDRLGDDYFDSIEE